MLKEYSANNGDAIDTALTNTPATAPDPGEFMRVDPRLIAVSATNRKHFDEAKLKEFEETIALEGITSNLTIRPLPAGRVADTAHVPAGWPKPIYELVAGERRHIVALRLALASVPVMLRKLSDAQAVTLQLTENLQREDLNELDEAEGYQRLMALTGCDRAGVAPQVGKKTGYVYARLKLLDLCTEGRTALRTGKIEASIALLLARIPDHKQQIKALGEVTSHSEWEGNKHVKGTMSQRKAQAHVQDNYMLKLGSAVFSITDASLVPAAGSCKTCTKRTGHAPDLFQDVKDADVCTHPPCFHAKEAAHSEAVRRAATASGHTVIMGKEAAELRNNHSYKDNFTGYKRLDTAEDSPTDKPLRKIIGKAMEQAGIVPVKIEGRKGELVDCITNEQCAKLLKQLQGQAEAAKVVSKEVKELAAKKAKDAADRIAKKYETTWRVRLLERAWTRIRELGGEGISVDVVRHVTRQRVGSLSADTLDLVARLLGLAKVGSSYALGEHITTCKDPGSVLMLMIMAADVGPHSVHYTGVGNTVVENEGLNLIAGEVLDNLATTRKQVQDEVRAELEPPKAQKPTASADPTTPTTPLAQPTHAAAGAKSGAKGKPPAGASAKGTPHKPTMSAQEATQGIAAAMQGLNEAPALAGAGPVANALPMPVAVGQQVRCTPDKKRLCHGFADIAGTLGKVVSFTGSPDEPWEVTVRFPIPFEPVSMDPVDLERPIERGDIVSMRNSFSPGHQRGWSIGETGTVLSINILGNLNVQLPNGREAVINPRDVDLWEKAART